MGNEEEAKINELSKVLDSIRRKVSGCDTRDLSVDMVLFTEGLSGIEQRRLDRFQNDRLNDIKIKYYAAIHKFEDKCTCER